MAIHGNAKRALAALGTVGTAAAMLLGSAGPSAAVDGPVEAKYYSPNGGGAHGKANMSFGGARTAYWGSVWLNDFCPGDDVRARIEFMVRYIGDSRWYEVGSREDVGGASPAPSPSRS